LEEVDYEKILGVIVDDRLSFIKHVDYVEKKCQKRLHWLRVLKRNGVKATHLRNLYLTMIRSTLTYAAEAWYGYLSKTQKDRLERVQRIALKYILPNIAYDDALVKLKLSSLETFIDTKSIKLLKNIENSGRDHKLYQRLPWKQTEQNNRVTRSSGKFNIELCRTEKRRNSFFPKTILKI